MQKILAIGVLIVMVSAACTPKKAVTAVGSLEELQNLMTGSFDSRAQAGADTNYYEISLHMYPIWTNRAGKWLYVEQAIYANQDKPYRQRVYGLEKGKNGDFVSRVYELPDPAQYVGAYKDPSAFDRLKLKDLREREGCAVYLTRDEDGTYRGSTNQNDCASTLRGASYATSRVSINRVFVQSWDRGFNADGEQVWGATEGGYMFLKN
ncbi:MAG: chromophore lyase CpcT/CpeT [Bacteroidota bacterium]